jgi:serine/threonine-protein kinase
MPLSPGDKLGPYEILAPIGAGGMGEVYRARDSKLNRDVALKVLTAALAQDADYLARFQREAQVLASLNHPNIAQIYGLEQNAIVIELVEGEEPRGPLPVVEALQIARQVAEALEAAHEKGIVHRDLKPANIKVTPGGTVKVLDFGLAKAAGPAAPASNANSPTLTMRATQAGVILGTSGYMAPEQAAGKPVDRRADIWSFGVVLWELLAGKRLFDGETISHTLASVLKDPIDLDALPNDTPPAIRTLVQRCLTRDLRTRLQWIGEARIALSDPISGAAAATATAPSRTSWLWPGGAAVMSLAALAVLFLHFRETPQLEQTIRSTIAAADDSMIRNFAVSPNGRMVVIAASIGGRGEHQQLWLRPLDALQAQPMPSTEDAVAPFWSPDSRYIGFFAQRKLKKIAVSGGPAQTLCDAPSSRGGWWSDDGGFIVATLNTPGGLLRIPAAGGTPQPLTQLKQGEVTHRTPQVLPGSHAAVFTVSSGLNGYEGANIEAVSLQNGARKTLWQGGYFGRYIPISGSIGYLAYVHQGTLFAVPFDPGRLEMRGAPVPVLEDLGSSPSSGAGAFDFQAGNMFYLSGRSRGFQGKVVWLDSLGETKPLSSKTGAYIGLRLSPDGLRVALLVVGDIGTDVWTLDSARDTLTRVSFEGQGVRNPTWAPDGQHIAFTSAATSSIGWMRADGAGEVQRLLENKGYVGELSFTPDGRRLAYTRSAVGNTAPDIWTVPLDLTDPNHPQPGKPELFLRGPFHITGLEFSPDGKWTAYASDESGTAEIFVRPFPGPGGKWQISSGGGTAPHWSRTGHQLIYQSGDQLMTASYAVKGDSFVADKPRVWIAKLGKMSNNSWDLAPDGKRIAMVTAPDSAEGPRQHHEIVLFQNFLDELRRKVPVAK